MWKKGAIGCGGLLAVAVVGLVAAVGYAAVAADAKLAFPDTPYPDVQASKDPEVIARGKYLVHGPAHCVQCHSTDDREHPEEIATAAVDGGLPFHMGPIGSTYAPNLTPHPTEGIGRWSDAEVARAIRSGVLPDGTLSIFMSTSIGTFSDEDLTAIVSYLRAMEPSDNAVPQGQWTLFGKVLLTYAFPRLTPRDAPAPTRVLPGEEPTAAHGDYLVEVAACLNCHTYFDQSTFTHTGPRGGGGAPEPSHGEDSDMEFAAPNLTSHPTGVTGRLTEDAFVARLQAGRTVKSSIMPWEPFQAMTEDDMRSIYRSLKALPPVDNDTGPTYRKIGWQPGD